MLLQRYALIHQRILRQDLFRPHLGSADATRNTLAHKITPVESLLGTHGSQLLLGMIVQVEEGRFYLEDPTAQVPIRLVGASILTDGFITENSIVLVEGEYLDGILMVHRLGNPLIETRNEAIQAMGLQASDMFQSMSSLAEVQKIKEQEAELGPNRMFVILSDLHLDQPQVMSKLEVLLEGFCPDAMQDDDDDEEDDPLPVFIFMGNFSSVPLPPHVMMGHLDDLATLISKFPRLAQDARFVLIPGPNDPGMGQILPRPPLPKSITSSLRSKLRHVHFGSNPCRLRYFSKELVLFRQDVVHLLWRQSLLQPRDGTTEVQQHTVKTMLDQAHLCPVPIAAQPIYWTLDHALRLYPLPDAILCGDRVAQYYENYADCDALNAGPFYKDYSFVVYRPVAQVDEDGNTKSNVEFSQINSD
jgi:DNA polymerase epsilon subunit 2